MPYKLVPLITGELYHIYNRGVDKRDVFLNKKDYIRFYQSLAFFNAQKPTQNFRLAKSHSQKTNHRLVNIHAYALLPNHFHLLLQQTSDGGISEFMKRITGGYTNYFNERLERSGALFQGVFKRVHINRDQQYRFLLAYINENHAVHAVDIKREVYHTSSVHYSGIVRSKLINERCEYDYFEAKSLANDINQQRVYSKKLLE